MSLLRFLILFFQPLLLPCLPDGLHPTPPMGWSAWNTFFSYNSEEKMIAQVRMSKAMSTKNLVQSTKSRIFQSEGLGSVASAVYSKCLNDKVTLFKNTTGYDDMPLYVHSVHFWTCIFSHKSCTGWRLPPNVLILCVSALGCFVLLFHTLCKYIPSATLCQQSFSPSMT